MENEKQEKILKEESAIYNAGCILFEMVRKQKQMEEKMKNLEQAIIDLKKQIEQKIEFSESKNCETKQPEVKAEDLFDDCVAKKKKVNRLVHFKRGIDVRFEGKNHFEIYHNVKQLVEKISKNKISELGGNSRYYNDCQGQMEYSLRRYNAIAKEYGAEKIVSIRRRDVNGKIYVATTDKRD